MSLAEEFKRFAVRGNVVDLAVAVVVGTAFGPIVKSAVEDVLMPPIGILVGNVDFWNLYIVLKHPPNPLFDGKGNIVQTLEALRSGGGVAIAYGALFNAVLNFLIVALAVFLLVKGMNRLVAAEPAPPSSTTKDCPLCCSRIPVPARRCPQCTADLPAGAAGA